MLKASSAADDLIQIELDIDFAKLYSYGSSVITRIDEMIYQFSGSIITPGASAIGNKFSV